MFRIPYGESNFEKIRTKSYLYIDKTRFIESLEMLSYIIHLRPRRFGKSLFVDMLDNYYDINSVERFDELFGGLYIHENPTDSKNNYYVLRLNFSGIQNTKMESLEEGFLRRVKLDAEIFINRYDLDITLDTSSATTVIDSLLSGFHGLALHHKIYIMVDEYDHFTNSLLSGAAEDFLTVLQRGGFVRSFYEVIKEKAGIGVIERLFITGVMSVTLDSMISGFNIAANITTRPEFADMMGFNDDEVKELLNYKYIAKPGKNAPPVQLSTAEQADIYDLFRENYNGYLFSSHSKKKVFNSTLIMYYLKNYLPHGHSPSSLIDPNLNQTGTTIESIVGLKNKEINYQIIEQIVNDKQVIGTLQPFINIDVKFDQNDLITLLYNIGTLTIQGFDMETVFEMPNKIIKDIYLQYLSDLIQRQSDYTLDLGMQKNAIVEFGRQGKIELLTALVSEFLMHTSGRNARGFDEKYIKLVYIMILTYSTQFSVYDELPALQGFSDILIFKSPNSTAKYEAIIELKYIKKSDATENKIEMELANGIEQIHNYMQDKRLATRENFKKFVIVFVGFEVARLVEI